jgi:adenylate kinase family enzyme
MPRIHVTGNAGVGKSTLAARIAALVDAPLFGLDEIVWKPGWKKSGSDERTPKEQALCAQPSWVIDGVSRLVRESADTIVFLDYPRRISFWRCARRNWRYLFKSRPGLPPGCPEIRIVPALARIIWRFPTTVRPTLLAEFDEWKGQKTLVHIRSDAELSEFMRRLESEHVVQGAV